MDDLISRQAAIDACRKNFVNNVFVADAVYNQGVENCLKRIKELPSAQPEQRWIPVSERLPEEEERGEYLTTNMYHNVFCDYWSGSHFDRTEVVIAWQPLPEPYKEETYEAD